jgi:voltage-gated potassium channel
MTVIREDSRLRSTWDALILALIVLTCVLVPYQVAFQHQVDWAGTVLLYVVDLFFLFDVFLNFRTSYRHQGAEVTDRAMIRRRYLTGLFAVDLLAALPLDALLLTMPGVELNGVSLVLLVRLVRLLRIVRLFVIFRRWESQSRTNAGFLRINKFFTVILLLLHWVACAWFLIPFMEGFPVDSWATSEGIEASTPATQYIRSMYWAIVTMTTVGFGDITPHRNIEYVFTMVVMLLGATLYAFIIGNIASLVSNLDSTKAAFWHRVESVNQYLRSRRVPPELNEQIRSYYEYIWSRYRGMDQESLFSDLPAPLRLEVLFNLTRRLIERVPLFQHCSPVLRNELLMALKPQIFAPGTVVVREGEPGNGVYFISRGTLEILSEADERSHGALGPGDYFGDLSLILGERRTASVKALDFCDVFVLDRANFSRIKTEYGEFREVLKKVAAERTDRISELVLEGVIL